MKNFLSIDDPLVAQLLAAGSVGVIPTDTIYGLAAAASNPAAVARLYALKDREQKPGTIIAAHIEQLVDLGLNEVLVHGVAHLWPNPLSIVIPVKEQLGYLDQNVGSLAVRIPQDEALRSLLAKTGPLVTSSANHPGEPPANNLAEAKGYFNSRVDFYVDGGDRHNCAPSTVVRLNTDGTLKTLREGALKISAKGKII